ncbi:hypothetical protein [Limnofasciculus baicalensis]|uniref:Uncharacterized protein n=1 Tax=Limnofasciculus baicalensis BBK-W-15 TaxID=2699891 RepID=A0AAE3GWN2_9CYAN|nr:hypothetical protein [Limnofasciculus baicalensis]MCP2732065.1 hypothetical protein [Limnofasciculus baicalensis BBK-W-15]
MYGNTAFQGFVWVGESGLLGGICFTGGIGVEIACFTRFARFAIALRAYPKNPLCCKLT